MTLKVAKKTLKGGRKLDEQAKIEDEEKIEKVSILRERRYVEEKLY